MKDTPSFLGVAGVPCHVRPKTGKERESTVEGGRIFGLPIVEFVCIVVVCEAVYIIGWR